MVIENGSQRWFYSLRRHAWRPVSWRPPEPRLSLLLRNYHILPGPVETVAGRRALRLRIDPRFPGNPHKQAWLDLATGITLRADLYDSSGRLVSRSEFLEFHPQRSLPASLFAVPDAGRQAPGVSSAQQTEREAPTERPSVSVGGGGAKRGAGPRARSGSMTSGVSPERVSFDPALPRYLPRGYVRDRITRTRSDGTEVARALFTDGLNTLSLLEWRGPREPEEGGRERFWGPGDRVRWNNGPIHAMLSGDLAAAELKRIAGSIGLPRARLGALVTRK